MTSFHRHIPRPTPDVDDDAPFRRPAPGADDDAPPTSTSFSATPWIGMPDPWHPIPDMRLHQPASSAGSLLPDSLATDTKDGPSDPGVTGRHSRSRIAVGVALCVLGTAVFLPSLRSLTTEPLPLVVDMPTHPTIAWSAEGGDVCASLDEDHAILFGADRVWSLDLRDGRTRWSVDLSARSPAIKCLPGTNLVSITEKTAIGTVLDVTLLDASTGRVMAELAGETTVQVIPMGSHLGLLGPENVLSMVRPNRLDSPIWSRRLSGPPGQLDQISVHHIDDSVVQLSYSVIAGPREPSPQLSEILSIREGEPPEWVDDAALDQAALIHRASYSQVGGVILHNDVLDHASRLVASDQQGRELWSQGKVASTIVGSRLFLSSHEDWGDGWSRLHEVDPRSGTPVNDRFFDQTYRYASLIADNRLLIAQEDALSILDERMQPQSSIRISGLRSLFQGSQQLFLLQDIGDHSSVHRLCLTAVDAQSLLELWTLELAPGQDVEQMGRHLVLVDDDAETMHGLISPDD